MLGALKFRRYIFRICQCGRHKPVAELKWLDQEKVVSDHQTKVGDGLNIAWNYVRKTLRDVIENSLHIAVRPWMRVDIGLQ